MTSCSEYDRLDFLVEDVLGDLAQLATLELNRFQAGDYPSCKRLDKAVDGAVWKKDHFMEELRLHVIEHNCQAGKSI